MEIKLNADFILGGTIVSKGTTIDMGDIDIKDTGGSAMGTTKQEIEQWFDRGINEGATHMIVVCDSFDYEDYPVFVSPAEDVKEIYSKYDGKNMQRVMEVYNLSMNKESQFISGRAFNF